MEEAGGYLYQDLGVPFQANKTYRIDLASYHRAGTGHASVQFWSGEQLLGVNQIASLANAGKYPFFAPMTCAEGYFIYPQAPGMDYPSFAESIVRADGKGAIASFSPTGFGLANGHDLLSQGLYTAIFYKSAVQLGVVTTSAKYFLFANSGSYSDLIDTYILFGDPATRLQKTANIYLPFLNR
jgi:hypothetical protein